MLINPNESGQSSFKSDLYFIPGYTGHCPTLKFHFGKCYGASTREILRTLSRKEPVHQSNNTANCSFYSGAVKDNIPRRKYILGYTGFIPGMYQHYGKSFNQVAEKCETNRMLKKVSFERKLRSFNHSKNKHFS